MSKEILHGLLELLPEEDTQTIYNVLIKFIPESDPELDELEAITEAKKDIVENGTVSHDAINWG